MKDFYFVNILRMICSNKFGSILCFGYSSENSSRRLHERNFTTEEWQINLTSWMKIKKHYHRLNWRNDLPCKQNQKSSREWSSQNPMRCMTYNNCNIDLLTTNIIEGFLRSTRYKNILISLLLLYVDNKLNGKETQFTWLFKYCNCKI